MGSTQVIVVVVHVKWMGLGGQASAHTALSQEAAASSKGFIVPRSSSEQQGLHGAAAVRMFILSTLRSTPQTTRGREAPGFGVAAGWGRF